MFCLTCGTQNQEGATYCGACGRKLVPDARPNPSARRNALVAVIVVSCAVTLVSVALIVMHLLGSPTQDASNNMALCANGLARKDGYDYFFVEADHAICRARTGGGPGDSEHVIDVPEGTFVNDLAISGDQIIYVTNWYQTENVAAVSAASLDGSDYRTLVTAAELAQGAESVSLGDLAVFGDRVYLRKMVNDSDSWERRNDILSMRPDGSDLRVEGSFIGKNASVYATLLTPDKFYYAAAPDTTGRSTTCTVYSQNLDGSHFSQLYQSDVGIIYHLGTSGNRLVFDEVNYTVQKTVVTSTKLDGTDPVRLYTAPTDTQAKLATVADDRAYVIQTNTSGTDPSSPVTTILSIPLLGGNATQVWTSTSLQSPEIAAAGDHLVVFENSFASYGLMGDLVFAIDFDGGWLGTYAVSPYGEPKLDGSGLPGQQPSASG